VALLSPYRGKHNTTPSGGGFFIFCGVAVNIHKVPLSDAKDLARVLPDWLEQRLYFPVLRHFPERLKQKTQRDVDLKNDLNGLIIVILIGL